MIKLGKMEVRDELRRRADEPCVHRHRLKLALLELPSLIDRAEAGEEVIITRQGKPVAKLVAAPNTLKPLPSLKEFRSGIGKAGTPAAQLLRAERNADRDLAKTAKRHKNVVILVK